MRGGKSGISQLMSVQHIVLLMLENRSFDHMLGFLYAGEGNKSRPVRDSTGDHAHKELGLRTSRDYDRYIEKRTEAWKASRAAVKKTTSKTTSKTTKKR